MARKSPTRMLDLFSSPLALVFRDGGVPFVNEAGRMRYGEKPFAFDDNCVPSDVRRPEGKAIAIPVEVEGRMANLVLLDPSSSASSSSRKDGELSDKLSPALERVARLLVEGMSDKEISFNTDLSLATVRTYVSRIYRRLEVGGRRELVYKYIVDNREN